MENQDIIISEINKIISEEIKFLNRYYDYDLKRFFCTELFYGSAFLSFFNIKDIRDFDTGRNYRINNHLYGKANFSFFDTGKIIDLITGIELLAIGLNIHSSHENILRKVFGKSENPEKIIEKNYTIELLFGDIFYSRAISYLINFDDFVIFDNILKSLLSVHHSRIIIHQMIKDVVNGIKNIYWFFNEGLTEIKMLNALLKEMFFTGIGVSNLDVSGEKTKEFLGVIDKIVLLKTYNDLDDYTRQALSESSEAILYNPADDFYARSEDLKKSLEIEINKLEPEWIKDNFLKLSFKFV